MIKCQLVGIEEILGTKLGVLNYQGVLHYLRMINYRGVELAGFFVS